MTTWGTGIKSNDTSLDIYFDFFQDYNNGLEPNEIAKKIIEANPKLRQDPAESNNFWLGLSLALWETQSLDFHTLKRVTSIIESGLDLELWKRNGATKTTIAKRKLVLEIFLAQIIQERDNPVPRKKKVHKEPVYKKGTCFTFKLVDGYYGGAVVLESDRTTGFGYCLIANTRIHQVEKPTLSDFKKTNVLNVTYDKSNNEPHIRWYFPDRFKNEFAHLFEEIGEMEIELHYSLESKEIKTRFSADWSSLIEVHTKQLEHEKSNETASSTPLKQFVQKPKWYKIF